MAVRGEVSCISGSAGTELQAESDQVRVFVVAKTDFVVDGLLNMMDQHHWIRVLTCVEPSEACWHKFENDKPDILLLHSDVFRGPPGELTNRVREASPSTSILVFGWNMSQDFLTSLLVAGVRGYINENMSGSHLISAIECVSNGRLWVERVLLEDMAMEALQMHDLMEKAILERIDSFRDQLTPRETTVLRHVLEGLCTKEIAGNMNVSEQSVKMHLSHMFSKLEVTNRSQLILRTYAKICPVSNMIRLFRKGLDHHRARRGRTPAISDPLSDS